MLRGPRKASRPLFIKELTSGKAKKFSIAFLVVRDGKTYLMTYCNAMPLLCAKKIIISKTIPYVIRRFYSLEQEQSTHKIHLLLLNNRQN